MRCVCERAGAVLHRICGEIRPGVTTGEIDRLAAEFIAAEGCRSAFLGYQGFPGHICISTNEEVIHGVGGKRRIEYGDIVKIDCGVVRDGWIGDTAMTIPVGVVAPEVMTLLRVTERSLFLAIQNALPGARLGNVSAAIEDEVRSSSFSVVREFVGHGVGRELHEEPQIPNFGRRNSGPILRPGMTLAIEPMVNMGVSAVRVSHDNWTVVTADGRPSAHFEHTVLITESEPEILTLPLHRVSETKNSF